LQGTGLGFVEIHGCQSTFSRAEVQL
jgi:hypothetical protein